MHLKQHQLLQQADMHEYDFALIQYLLLKGLPKFLDLWNGEFLELGIHGL